VIPDIERQIAAMRRDWPAWEVVTRVGECATWRGPLCPTTITYEVEIRYRIPLAIENGTVYTTQPRVTVEALAPHFLSPVAIELHLYWPAREDSSPPTLCLFDPHAHPVQWSVEDLLAETTLPWTCEWLLYFEGWLVTRSWEGGGRHPTPSRAA